MAPRPQAAYTREFAPQYEANIVPRFRPIAERLAELAQPKAGDRVLELAGGTGGLTRLIAPRVDQVVLTDLSRPMLDVAAEALARLKIRNVLRMTADLAALPFSPGQFDLVVAQMSPLQERTAWLRSALAQLRKGGRIAIAQWGAGLYSEVRLQQAVRAELGLPPLVYGANPKDTGRALRRLGLAKVAVEEARIDQTWDDVADYIRYRRSFGGPPLPPRQKERLYRVLEEHAHRLARGGRLSLYWRVGYITGRT
ncbi:MAG TPA: class I SAM-dependent methyltransferase [Candidatus Dormibacteraeota bacterium]